LSSTSVGSHRTAEWMTRCLFVVHLLVVPVIVGTILFVRGKELEQTLTQLWWVPAIKAQISLIAFVFAFASFPHRATVLLCACLYVVAAYILSNSVLYEHVVQFDGSYAQRLNAIWEDVLLELLLCSTLLLPFRWIFGVISRETAVNPTVHFRIMDLLLSTFIFGLALAIHRTCVASLDRAEISTLGPIEQIEQFNLAQHWIFGYSLDSMCILGLTLVTLSRFHWFTGSILFLSAITLNLSFITAFPVLSSALFLSRLVYQWGVVTATLVALRFLGFRISLRINSGR
jgi:hypothetical protein